MSTEELDEKPKALPPQKRRRVIKDDEDDEDASFHDEEEEDDDEEELIDHSDKENGTENDEQDTPRKQINKPGAPPEAGVIDEILVEDFMCHKKLRVKLCRNVNFINGANGSGKSAILAAIQICLGAGARRTHRARSLKELIRKDGSSTPSCAKVQVTLLNGGSDGYKQDVYGKKITVERCISNGSGYNGYKLLDEKGKERSRSKKDLDEMLDTLNIQVDNPVSILDQEESKKFLTGKSSDKYNFFMKATELERIDNKFSTALDTLQEMTASQAKLIESLERDKKQVQELKKRWEVHKELDKMQDKIRSLGVKYAWAFFQVADKEHADAVTDYETFMAKAAKKEEELTQLQLSMSQPKEQEDRLNNKSHELIEEGNKQSALKNDLEIRLRNAKHPVKDLERQLAASKREEARAKTALHAAQKRLKEVRDQIIAKAGSAKEEAARRASELKEAEEALEEATARKEELVQRVSTAHQQYEEHEPQLKDKKAQVKEIKRQIQVVEGRIQSLSQTTDELAVFGRNVKRMHDMIEKTKREKKFRGPVLGPIGKHIKVVPGKEKYAAIAELAVGRGNLDRFIVTNDHDRRLVQSIRDKIGCQKDCNIFQVKDTGRYNVPPPPAGVENVCTVFAISEDLVFNCLGEYAFCLTPSLESSFFITDSFSLQSTSAESIRADLPTIASQARNSSCTESPVAATKSLAS